MSVLKPIRRSKQLAPLSRKHRETLSFILNLKSGLANRTPPGEMVAYVRWYWSNFLQPHFKQEEDILLTELPASDELAQRLRLEYSNITELITSPLGNSGLTVLANALTNHIRFEERLLYTHIEQTLSKAQLNNIYQQLEQQTHCNEKWENEFWKRKLPVK